MEKAGDIYLAGYKGWYSVRDEAFYAESETVRGADGVRLGPQGTPVEWTEEQTYFFRLSKYEKKLLKLYEQNPDFILPPERRNEIVSFVKGGLRPLDLPHDARLGHPRSRRAGTYYLCLGRCADELHHRRGIPQGPVEGLEGAGPPRFMSSARTLRASTRCTGPLSDVRENSLA